MTEAQVFMTPQELVDRLVQDRTAFAALWQNLSPAQMVQRPGPQADWSVKDLIAHITWWELFALGRMTQLLAGETPAWIDSADAINAQVYRENVDRTLGGVLAAFNATPELLISQILTISTEDLNNPNYTGIGITLLHIYTENTFRHYADHRDDLRAYVATCDDTGPKS